MGEFFRRIYYLLNRGRMERELQSDMEAHREMLGTEHRKDFGNATLVAEQSREAWGWGWLERLLQDARYGFRMLCKNPGFSVVAIIALALGIGANTALFSIVYGVLLKPLPYAQGNELVVLDQSFSKSTMAGMPGMASMGSIGFSVKEIQDYREQAHSLAQVEEYHGMGFILLDGHEPSQVRTGVVSAHYFDMLGIKPQLGRFFTEADDKPGADAVLILSYGYWTKHYGGDPTIVGRRFRMNDKVHTVVGVLPPVPQYPNENDVYMPTVACPFRSSPRMMNYRDHRMMTVLARLKSGESLEAGKTDVAMLAARLEKTYPESYPANAGFMATAKGLRSELTQQVRPMLLVLLGMAGLVLLIACANVANLALARMMRREQELAVRAALGASRGRLVRQLLTESTMLSLAGGALGLLLASGCLDLLVRFVGRFTTRAGEVSISMPVLLFTLGVAVVTGLVFGSIPAFSQKLNLVHSLKEGSSTATVKLDGNRVRNVLAMGQVALSFMLLIAAGLMIRSFIKLQQVDAGYVSANVLTANVPLNFSKYKSSKDRNEFFDRVTEQLRGTPGIQAIGVNGGAPLSSNGPMSIHFFIEGRTDDERARREAAVSVASPEAFRMLGMPLIKGRAFTDEDVEKSLHVAVISQGFARHYFPDEDPLGKKLSGDQKEWITIVGVVGDVKQYGLDQDPVDTVYLPAKQANGGGTILIKTAGEPMNYAKQLRAAVYAVDPEQPITDVESLDQLRGDSLAGQRLTSILLALFAALALAIAATGLSGVTSLLVSQRTREIGIRLALGAQRSEVLTMVVKQIMRVILIGLAAGVVIALLLSRVMSTMLFQTPTTDPLTFVGVAVVLLAVALAASYIPARRVTRVNPLIALRSE